jgi:hypothetical protein
MKVVLFTGYSDERLERLGAVTGGFMLLRKPCGLPMLIHTFRRMLEKQSRGEDGVLRVAEEAEDI